MIGVAPARVLLIDDDPEMEWVFRRVLEPERFRVSWVGSAARAFERLEGESYDVVCLDLVLPGANGIEVLRRMRGMDPGLPVVMITAHGDIPTAVEAVRLGARDFLTKPFDNERLRLAVGRALERSSPAAGVRSPRARAGGGEALRAQMGGSLAVEKIARAVGAVAPTDYTVVIQGETGAGKEVVARYIHRRSPRGRGPFVGVDCGAVPGGVLESHLFGHEKGAFTGADAQSEGILGVARGGTVLLDEVANLTPDMQRKFLRVLEEKEFFPVGGRKAVRMDVRVLAACNGDLEDLVKKGDFREDLYHRLSEFSIRIPPLRERKEDVPFLADKFRRETNLELGKAVSGCSEEAMGLLLEYDYPGNVRELKNIIRRAMLWADGTIEEGHLAFREASASAPRGLDVGLWVKEGLSLREITGRLMRLAEGAAVEEALRWAEYNRTKAARVLKVDRKTLYRKMKDMRR